MITERIDRITAVETRSTRMPAPKSVKIELTGKCNFSCSFCARSQALRDQQHMDQALYMRLAKELLEAGVEELGLFYLGESMMVPWLPEAIAYAKEIGFPYVFLTTNGSLAKPKKLEACFRSRLDSLKFSLNYADEDQFVEIARCPGALFHLMQDNIKAAREIRDRIEKETGHRCGLYASYIEYDGEQKQRMAALVEKLSPYLDEVYALPLYSQAELTGTSEREKGWNVTAGNRGRLGRLRNPLPCWAVFNEGHITWDGKLSACCFDHDGRFEMGDLTKTPFLIAWNGGKFRSLRAAHLAENVTGTVCENCVAYAD